MFRPIHSSHLKSLLDEMHSCPLRKAFIERKIAIEDCQDQIFPATIAISGMGTLVPMAILACLTATTLPVLAMATVGLFATQCLMLYVISKRICRRALQQADLQLASYLPNAWTAVDTQQLGEMIRMPGSGFEPRLYANFRFTNEIAKNNVTEGIARGEQHGLG